MACARPFAIHGPFSITAWKYCCRAAPDIVRKREKITDCDRISKSQRKRESLELQSLGEALIGFRTLELRALNLPELLLNAIREAQQIRQRGALRRQKQYIGRLMREVDAEPIRRALARHQMSFGVDRQRFRNAEKWRERILKQGEPAIRACLEQISIDEDILRELANKAKNAGSPIARKSAATELFRHLHAALNEQ